MLKAVIFDMDGVIIDSEPIYHKVEMELFREMGLPISDEDRNAFIGAPLKDMWAMLKEKYKLDEEVAQLVKIQMKSFRECLMSIEDNKPIEGVDKLINDLYERGITIGLASSSAIEDIETVLSMFKLKGFFKTVASADEVKRGKPWPDVFILASQRLDISPEECIVIEDSRNGVQAAKAANMKCIGFRNLNSGNQDLSKADFIIKNFSEIDLNKLFNL